MSDMTEKEHIVALKKALQTMYENGYDSTCDAIEDTLSERDDLQKRVAELEERHRSILSKIEMVRRDRDYWMTKYQTDILGFNEPAHD